LKWMSNLTGPLTMPQTMTTMGGKDTTHDTNHWEKDGSTGLQQHTKKNSNDTEKASMDNSPGKGTKGVNDSGNNI